MAGILYLCATPIGNLEDMTFRAVRILREADLIAAEATRNSIKLLRHFEIRTPMTSYHEYNQIEKGKKLTALLLEGKNIALITDAGTPGISVNWEPSPSPAPEEQEEAPWYLRLVNLENRLPQDFTVELAQVDGGQFDARAAEALSQMLADMEAQGLSPMVCSSFRTWEDQETLHQNKIGRLLEEGYSQEAAEAEASRWVVPAGASEHQLGLAADIVASQYQILEEEQENTPEQQWLMAHCQEYGFILRYPKDKTEVTGVGYEPWHYRYVGVEAAQ